MAFCCSYDYILRTETMTSDARYILPLLNRTLDALKNCTANVTQRNDTQSATANSQHDGFKSKYLTDFKQISAENVAALLLKYHEESLFFGYGFDDVTFKTTCAIPTSNGPCC